ncbi:MAG: endonuclease/exonuclease/phosphatase family protein [Sphingomonadales bacterium]|nr:endonuclease/exonuclease/phosphatase family protein [Sphingomonadales bacterium]
MQLTFASYNIHKAVGLDRRRDPERILAVLHEIDADVVALQEADRRFGRRETVLPRAMLDDLSNYRAIPLNHRPDSIGWHGNALLVKRGIAVTEAGVVALPTLEPRGAVRADLVAGGHRLRVVGMHLDLSGLRRRQQLRTILAEVGGCGPACPAVLMGDFNEWALHGGAWREFHQPWRVLTPGRSFPSRRPLAQLDRIVISGEWRVDQTQAHHSALSAIASDHLPVTATLTLPKK